ncbi:gamma-glutamyltransferase, partial [candidate division KSB1 bacterium]
YESTETTHYSVVDAAGNAVVVTYTLEYGYGSRIVAEGTGFLLNNEMGDFNPQPGRTDSTGLIGTPPNIVAPGKRMLSSMTPTIVAKDGKPFLLIGSPGGRTIINTVLQVIVNVIDFDMDISEAVAAPRIHHQWLPNRLRIEEFGISKDTERLLQMFGHRVSISRSSRSQGSAMGIIIDPKTGLRLGAADPRASDGAAVGY